MSTYPTAFDATFPGYPYIDNTQFLDQTQANAWVQAIQAIEATIGYGAAGTPASPLYSATYATTYTTVAARMAGLEATVAGGLKLNTSAANIQAVGTVAQAGNSGLAADAKHVHPGVAAASLKQIGEVFIWPAPPNTYPAGGGTVFQCNGQLISTSTYATLFGIVGYTYGGSGGSFGLPNYNDRFPIGVGTIAASAGAVGGSTTITQNNMPVHTHVATSVVTDPTHGHASYIHEAGNQYQGIYLDPGSSLQINLANPTGTGVSWSPGSPIDPGVQNHWEYAGTGISVATTNQSAGAGAAYTQPYIGTYFLIRAL